MAFNTSFGALRLGRFQLKVLSVRLNRPLLFSTGAHGLRHSYTQERMLDLNALGFKYKTALETVSKEMEHFRAEITEIYLAR